jgi:hypothetical protein
MTTHDLVSTFMLESAVRLCRDLPPFVAETMFTSFTTPESIARNDPAMLVRGSSAYTKSDGRSELLFAGSMFGPSPPPEPWITPPPKGTRF